MVRRPPSDPKGRGPRGAPGLTTIQIAVGILFLVAIGMVLLSTFLEMAP